MNRQGGPTSAYGLVNVWLVVLAGAMTILGAAAQASAGTRIREENTVVVNRVAEVWRFQWKNAPATVCAAEEADVSLDLLPWNVAGKLTAASASLAA